jgi:acetyl esterase
MIAHGVSAGGHLAAIAAESDAAVAPNVLVLWSPGVAAAEDPFFRGLVADPSRVLALSPLDQVRPGMAPAIVISGARDVVTPDDGAKRFCAKVKAAGSRVRFTRSTASDIC